MAGSDTQAAVDRAAGVWGKDVDDGGGAVSAAVSAGKGGAVGVGKGAGAGADFSTYVDAGVNVGIGGVERIKKYVYDSITHDKVDDLVNRVGPIPDVLKSVPGEENYDLWIKEYDQGSSVARAFAAIYKVFQDRVERFKKLSGDAKAAAIKRITDMERATVGSGSSSDSNGGEQSFIEDYQYIQIRAIWRVMMKFLGGDVFDSDGKPARLTTDELNAISRVRSLLGLQAGESIPDDSKTLQRIMISKRVEADWKAYKNFWVARPSGEPSEIACFRKMIAYQMEFSTLDRARQSRIHGAMRNHARNFYNLGYEVYMRLNWMYSGWLIRVFMGSNILTQTSRYITDTVSRGVTTNPVAAGQAMLNVYQARVLARRPRANTSSSAYAVTAIIVCTALVAEVCFFFCCCCCCLLLFVSAAAAAVVAAAAAAVVVTAAAAAAVVVAAAAVVVAEFVVAEVM